MLVSVSGGGGRGEVYGVCVRAGRAGRAGGGALL